MRQGLGLVFSVAALLALSIIVITWAVLSHSSTTNDVAGAEMAELKRIVLSAAASAASSAASAAASSAAAVAASSKSQGKQRKAVDTTTTRKKTWARRCNAEEADALAAGNWQNSGCPNQDRWLKEHAKLYEGQATTLVSVGCNKGYEFVHHMRMFSGNSSYVVKKLTAAHTPHLHNFVHGVCTSGAREADPIPASQRIAPIRGYCVEPMEENYKLLVRAMSSLRWEPPAITLSQVAVSSAPGWVVFNNYKPGEEHASLATSTVQGRVEDPKPAGAIDIVTLDSFVEQHEIDVIDWLSVDTEGFDMKVIFGASSLLARGKIRLLDFETHSIGHWPESSLEDLVDLLDNFGYTCYWEPNTNGGQLWQVTGCWRPAYKDTHWKNMACVLRTEPVHEFMQKMAMDQLQEQLRLFRDKKGA